MTPARAAACLAAVAALACAGCGDDPPPVALACMGEPSAITDALRAAPEPVRLPDGTSISACVRDAVSDADLQNVGVTLSNAAEDLEAKALDGSEQAGLELGYLVGAARKGGARSNGIAAELVHRLERSAALDGGTDVDVVSAVTRGLAAGEERG